MRVVPRTDMVEYPPVTSPHLITNKRSSSIGNAVLATVRQAVVETQISVDIAAVETATAAVEEDVRFLGVAMAKARPAVRQETDKIHIQDRFMNP